MSALQEGADADNKGAGGRNAIINAAWRGRDHILEIMLENGADIDVADDLGRTPLIWGAINGHRSVVSALLKIGPDPDKRDGEGVTALMRTSAGVKSWSTMNGPWFAPRMPGDWPCRTVRLLRVITGPNCTQFGNWPLPGRR